MNSKIYTRQGDQGETSLADGTRLSKDAPRVEAYGTIDEANSWIGVARGHLPSADPLLDQPLEFLQHRLYNCSSNVASPLGASTSPPTVSAEDVAFLEGAVDRFEVETGPLRSFVLPGGSPAAGFLHVARTVCRRAERCLVSLAKTEVVDPLVLRFLNRSSDLLFAAARYANSQSGHGDITWQKDLLL